jgi:hypothetical protein
VDHGTSGELAGDSTVDSPPILGDRRIDVPYQLDVLPDGREALVIGDVEELAEFNHLQGDNPYGFLGTCGLCSCQDVLCQFGITVSEADVVRHAVENGQCNISDDPAECGGTTAVNRLEILADYGVPAHLEMGGSLEGLALDLEEGRGVIIGANAGVLWNDPAYYEFGQSNHAVTVTGVARDPETSEIQGFFINDSGTGESAHFIDSSVMTQAWLGAGGVSVVTDVVRNSTGGSAS